MVDQALARHLDGVWGDPTTWTAEGLHWTHLPAVLRAINRRVTGSDDLDLLTWFFDRVAQDTPLPLGRVLVLGCGSAGHERNVVARGGWVRESVAFDLSLQALELARAKARDVPGVLHVQADMDDIPVGQPPFLPGTFDAVLGISSVHHASRLAELFARLHTLLVPGGWFFLNEYVGPDRFQYPGAQLRLAAQMAETLGPALMTTAEGNLKRGFRAPPVADVIRVDPTEAVCSSQILPLLQEHFETVLYRPFGGALLHLVLGAVGQNFLHEGREHLGELLVAAEDELYRQGLLPHDFACVIARARR